jgi:hypothetical protein
LVRDAGSLGALGDSAVVDEEVDESAGSGEVSTFTESLRSDDALRNSRMLLPSADPTSGS